MSRPTGSVYHDGNRWRGAISTGRLTPRGTYERLYVSARTAAEAWRRLEQRAAGIRMPTFSRWAAVYLGDLERRRRPATVADRRRALDLAVKHFGEVLLGDLTPQLIRDARRAVRASAKTAAKTDRIPARFRGNVAANRWLVHVRASLELARELGLIAANPCNQVKPLPVSLDLAPEALTEEELLRVLAAIDQEAIVTKAALTMLLETGARVSEVLRARRADVDLETGVWRLPRPKSGKPQAVPLPSRTLDLLRDLPEDGPWMISGRDPRNPRHDLRRAWERVRERAGVTAGIRVLRRRMSSMPMEPHRRCCHCLS